MSYKELQAIKDVLEHKQGNYLDDEINALITGIERLQSENARLKAELDKAVTCIRDIETYLDLGSGKYIKKTIEQYIGVEESE